MDPNDVPALDLKQLSYFITLAEHGSISSAAAILGLAQPSLSENITRLERKLEVQLIVRGPRGVHLTEAGFALARHGREIVESAALAISDIRQLGGEARGRVSIAFPPSLSLLLSVPLAETIQNERPLIKLHIAEALSGHVIDWLNSDKLDIGCAYEANDSAGLLFQPLLEEQLFLVAAHDNWPTMIVSADAGQPSIAGLALQELPLVLPSASHGARKVVERFCRTEHIHLNVAMEIDSLPQIISMVERASAYTILPHAAVMSKVADGNLALIPIVEPIMSRTAYLVRKRSRSISTASKVVEDSVKIILAEMVGRFNLKATLCYAPPIAGK